MEMTKKIYLETFKKCARSLYFPLLFTSMKGTKGLLLSLLTFSARLKLKSLAKYFTTSFTIVRTIFTRSLHKGRRCTVQGVGKFFSSISRPQRLIFITNAETIIKKHCVGISRHADYANMLVNTTQYFALVSEERAINKGTVGVLVVSLFDFFF